MDQGADMTTGRRRRPGHRWLGRDRRHQPDVISVGEEHGALSVSVCVDRPDVAVVTLSGLLLRQHADALVRSLTPVFAGEQPLFVIDLGGVTRLDPTALAMITRRADAVRWRGATVTIVPPGAGRGEAA